VGLAAHASLDPALSVDVLEDPPTPVAGFVLEASEDEPLWFDSLRFAVTSGDGGGGDEERLAELSLHRDGDGDGLLDRPSIPLARGGFDPSGDLVFRREEEPIALLGAGESGHFLLVAGVGLPARRAGSTGGASPHRKGGDRTEQARPDAGEDERSSAGGTLAPGAPRAPGSSGGGAANGRALILLAAILALSLGRRRRRVRLAALLLLVPSLACRDGSSGSGGTGPDGSGVPGIELRLSPGGLVLRGGVTSSPPTLEGDELVFRFDLR